MVRWFRNPLGFESGGIVSGGKSALRPGEVAARLSPGSDEGVDSTMIFNITEGFWPHIYEAHGFQPDVRPRFGISIKAEELPPDLMSYAKVRGEPAMVHVCSDVRPRVFAESPSGLKTVLQYARDANIPLDLLLSGVPMRLVVRKAEWGGHGFGPHKAEKSRTLALMGVRVGVGPLLDRLDDLRIEFFAGG